MKKTLVVLSTIALVASFATASFAAGTQCPFKKLWSKFHKPAVTSVAQPCPCSVTPVVKPVATPVQPVVTPVAQQSVKPVITPVVSPVVKPVVQPVVKKEEVKGQKTGGAAQVRPINMTPEEKILRNKREVRKEAIDAKKENQTTTTAPTQAQ